MKAAPFLALVLLLSACSGGPRATPQYFTLSPGEPASLRAMQAGATASVSFVDVAAPFAANGFVYRLGGGQWETDPYNQFLVSPAAMMTSIAREWVRASGLYAEVAEPNVGGGQEYVIDLEVTELYGDFRNPSAPVAVLTMNVQVLRQTNHGRIQALRKSFTRSVPIEARRPEAVVKAWNEALRIQLNELLRALSGVRG